MNISSKGIELLKQWEGFSNTFYKDIAGYLTVGVGHLVTKSELSNGYVLVGDKKIPLTGKLTDSEVSLLLEKDLTKFVEEVNSSIKVSLNQNQFDALVCFCYNIGTSAFKNSTLVKVLNAKSYNLVQSELKKWTKAKGKTIQGLVNRRNNEIKLWEGKL